MEQLFRSHGPLGPFLAVFVILWSGCGHPSDEHLVELFHERRHVFEELKRMSDDDAGLVRIDAGFYSRRFGKTFNEPSSYLAGNRWTRYRALFRQVDLDAGLRRAGVDSVEFLVSCVGPLTSGHCKGIAYSEHDDLPLRASLDGAVMDRDIRQPGIAYRKIEDNWYVFFMR